MCAVFIVLPCVVCVVSLCAVCVVLFRFADAPLWFPVGKMWPEWVEFRQDSNSYISTDGARDCGSASDAVGGITVAEKTTFDYLVKESISFFKGK